MENYVVNPRYNQPRNKDRELHVKTVKMLKAKWRPMARRANVDIYGDQRPEWDRTSKKFVLRMETNDLGKYKYMYEVISAALLLYRLIVLFAAKVYSVPSRIQYANIWWVTLKHKETGIILTFGERKAAAGIWTSVHRDQMPESFKADTLELLNILADPKCPHPYDGCVAGSVA